MACVGPAVAVALATPRLLLVGDAAAREGHEGIGAVRGIVVARPVLPHAAFAVPFLAVGPEPLQPNAAADLVELAAREDGARGADRLHLVDGPLHDPRAHALLRRHRQRAALEHSY